MLKKPTDKFSVFERPKLSTTHLKFG